MAKLHTQNNNNNSIYNNKDNNSDDTQDDKITKLELEDGLELETEGVLCMPNIRSGNV